MFDCVLNTHLGTICFFYGAPCQNKFLFIKLLEYNGFSLSNCIKNIYNFSNEIIMNLRIQPLHSQVDCDE